MAGWSAERRDHTVDRRFYLGSHEADVPKGSIVELAKTCDGGATGEIARDSLTAGGEEPRKSAGPMRDFRLNGRCKGGGHLGLHRLLRGNATLSAHALVKRAARSSTADIFAAPDTIGLMHTKCSDIFLDAIRTLISVQ